MTRRSSRSVPPKLARRIAITRQHLAGPRRTPDSEGIMDVVRDLGYLQIDPMRVVERSHLLVLWSRLGPYDVGDLNRLLWKGRRLFEDWAQTTSIVLTQDYPIFSTLKRGFPAGNRPWARRIRRWLKRNEEFSLYVLDELRRRGPLFSHEFEDRAVEAWRSTGWTAGRNVDMMLSILKAQGKVMIAGRRGNKKLWDLPERQLPSWTPREPLSDRELLRRVAQKSLRALGVAKATHVKQHFIRGCCTDIEAILGELERDGLVTKLEIEEAGRRWRGPWYLHVDDQPLLDQLTEGVWEPRTTLLSPFDNLICDRRRTEELFGFHFRLEVYVPKPKRQYGCYVMPILHGDRLIGRIDPAMDRKKRQLIINAIYAETGLPDSKESAQAVAHAIEELAEFLGADRILYGKRVPTSWKSSLQ